MKSLVYMCLHIVYQSVYKTKVPLVQKISQGPISFFLCVIMLASSDFDI